MEGTRDLKTSVRVLAVSCTRVWAHSMVHVAWSNGRTLEMSARHPTLEGIPFGELLPCDRLCDAAVVSAQVVPYDGSYTYDLLTDGDRGAYVADGVLVGSTLWRPFVDTTLSSSAVKRIETAPEQGALAHAH